MAALELNPIDIFILVGAVAILFCAFFQGIVRQLLYLLASYVALVVATQYHRPLGLWLGESVPAADEVLMGFSFVVLFLVAFGVMVTANRHITRSSMVPSVGSFDNLGGAAVGLVTAYLVLTVSLAIMQFGTRGVWPSHDGVRQATAINIDNSKLAAVVNSQAPVVFGTLKPFLPGGLPSMFTYSATEPIPEIENIKSSRRASGG